jgi:glucose dehydrogenase
MLSVRNQFAYRADQQPFRGCEAHPTRQVGWSPTKREDGDCAQQTGAPNAMYRRFLQGSSDLPCGPPPWGMLTAVDMSAGKNQMASATRLYAIFRRRT